MNQLLAQASCSENASNLRSSSAVLGNIYSIRVERDLDCVRTETAIGLAQIHPTPSSASPGGHRALIDQGPVFIRMVGHADRVYCENALRKLVEQRGTPYPIQSDQRNFLVFAEGFFLRAIAADCCDPRRREMSSPLTSLEEDQFSIDAEQFSDDSERLCKPGILKGVEIVLTWQRSIWRRCFHAWTCWKLLAGIFIWLEFPGVPNLNICVESP